jgi:hypothetical protein
MSIDATLTHLRLREPILSFDPRDTDATHTNPLQGLVEHGPHSKSLFTPEHMIRVVAIAPADTAEAVAGLLTELRSPAAPRERREYLPEYPGFQQAFRIRIGPAEPAARIALPADLDDHLAREVEPHRLLADTLTRQLRRLRDERIVFDVAMIHLPNRWSRWFTADQFDLHDHVKAVAAQLGIHTQIVNDDPMRYACRASVCWRLGTAIYAKAGGVPYKLATGGLLDSDAVYVGLAYGVRGPGEPNQQFVVCCSQIFDSAGGGLEFVAHDFGRDVDARNPMLSRDQMRTVLSRALNVYADGRAGHKPSSLVVHKQSDFTDDETAGAVDAWGAQTGLTCVSVTQSAWRGVEVTGAKDVNRPGPKYAYATNRGTLIQLGDYNGLLWISGNSREATLTDRNYLPGGKGTPRPVLINRFAGSGPLAETAAPVLALSKMDFNSDSPYTTLPVTIRYAQILARTAKTQPLPGVPYDFRLFM